MSENAPSCLAGSEFWKLEANVASRSCISQYVSIKSAPKNSLKTPSGSHCTAVSFPESPGSTWPTCSSVTGTKGWPNDPLSTVEFGSRGASVCVISWLPLPTLSAASPFEMNLSVSSAKISMCVSSSDSRSCCHRSFIIARQTEHFRLQAGRSTSNKPQSSILKFARALISMVKPADNTPCINIHDWGTLLERSTWDIVSMYAPAERMQRVRDSGEGCGQRGPFRWRTKVVEWYRRCQ